MEKCKKQAKLSWKSVKNKRNNRGKMQKTSKIIMEKCNFISIQFRINAIIPDFLS